MGTYHQVQDSTAEVRTERTVPAHAAWPIAITVDPGSTALVLIDLQNQFLRDDSPLAVADAAGLVARCNAFADVARRNDMVVVWVVQRAEKGDPPSVTAARFGVMGIHRGDGADLDARLDIRPEDAVVRKRRQSAFFATGLADLLVDRGVGTLLIGGVTTNVCVLATAKDAAERDLDVHVVEDLTRALPIAGGSPRAMEAEHVRTAALTFAQYAYGDVTSTARIRWQRFGPASESRSASRGSP